MTEPEPYDLLLRHGQLLDPASGRHDRLDVGIRDGAIAALAPVLDPARARRVIEVPGKLVTPGLIDLHTHIYPGAMPGALAADLAGVRAGVTTVVDAGSAGSHTFAGLRDHVLPTCQTRVVPFLNVARTGLAVRPEVRAREDVDLEATVELVRQHPGIAGLKLRAIGPAIPALGLDLVRLACQAARTAGRPLMVHIGETETLSSPPLTGGLLPLLEPGDVLTHVCTPHSGGILDAEGVVLPEARAAYAAGVTFDVGHGVRNFSFDVARRLLEQGIVPHTISTDMAVRPRRGPAYSLVETMAKWLALGLPLEAVVRMTTANPAAALGLADTLGTLRVGGGADLTVLDRVAGRWELRDSTGGTLVGEQALAPVLTIRAGEPISPDWGPHPWGWLPAPAET